MWQIRNLFRWLPGGKRPMLLGGGYSNWGKRRKGRKPLDFGPGTNFAIRIAIYGTALVFTLVLLTVKLATGQ